jgi:glycosyltransferase involved in cell wall biosynthesis
MRVVAYADSGVVSGAELLFCRTVNDLARAGGVHVDLAGSIELIEFFSRSETPVSSTIRVPAQATRLSALALVDPRRRRAVRDALSGTMWDVAFVNLPSGEYGATPLVDGVLGAIPTVGLLHVHQPLSELPYRLGRVRERIARSALRRMTRVCVLSSWAAEQVSLGWGIPRASIDVLPTLRPSVERIDSAAARAQLRLPDGPLVAIAGRVSFAQKGHDVLLEAAQALRSGHPTLRFVVAGNGPDLPRLRSEVARLGLEGSFVILGHVDAIGPLLSAVDAIVIPSRFEGLPLIALEALWAETPGVASRIDGLTQIWPEDWLVEPGDPAALAAGLELVLSMAASDRAAAVAAARERLSDSTATNLAPFVREVLRCAITRGPK